MNNLLMAGRTDRRLNPSIQETLQIEVCGADPIIARFRPNWLKRVCFPDVRLITIA
jgi:hypothetical protein